MSESLSEISAKLAQIILPTIMVLGIVGNSLNILILTRANLRNHSCSQYFLALSSNNLIYSIFLIYFVLADGYSIDAQYVSSALCKIIHYIVSASPFLSTYFIVLASIDRFCASSSVVKLRRFINVIIARRLIIILVTGCLLFFINTLVLYDLYDDGHKCNIQGNIIYTQIYILTEVILFAAVAPCLMSIFGFLTIYNINRIRVLPEVGIHSRRTRGQLARMLIVQVITFIVLNRLLCIIYLMLALPSGYKPTVAFYFAYTIAAFSLDFSFATTFFLYILSARIYRAELIRLIYRISPIRNRTRRQRQIHPISTTNQFPLIPISNNIITNTHH